MRFYGKLIIAVLAVTTVLNLGLYVVARRLLGEELAQLGRGQLAQVLETQKILLVSGFLLSLLLCFIVYVALAKTLAAREKLRLNAHELEELSLELQAILDGINTPILLISAQRMVRWANRAGAVMIGSTAPGQQGKILVDVPYISLLAEEQCPVARCFSQGLPVEYQYRLPAGDVELLARAFPLQDELHHTREVILLQQDVTERANLQHQSEQMNRLASLGEVAAGVAHEINNPIGMIQVNLNLFADIARDLFPYLDEQLGQNSLRLGGVTYPKLRSQVPLLLAEMLENCQRVGRLVEDLKGFSRREELRSFALLDANDAIESAVRLVHHVMREGGNELEFDLMLPLPHIYGARHRIEQVLVNLLLNAHYASVDCSAPILLCARYKEAINMLMLQVIDSGCGMSPEVLAHATDPFFTTRRNGGGTGLGLSLSTRIVEDHGGTLHIESRVGQGTVVTLYLPVAERE